MAFQQMGDPEKKWKKKLIIFLVGLAAFIGILVLIVVIRGCNTNKISEHGSKPEIENEVIEQPTKEIPEFKITGIELLQHCRIKVMTSLDGIYPERRSVRISIIGRDNPSYQRMSYFNANNIKFLDIWAIYGNDTIPYEENGKSFIGRDCP
jgi:hypothetical protein